MGVRYVLNPFTGNFDAIADADPVAAPFTFKAKCQLADVVDDVVRVDGPNIGGLPSVRRVNIASFATMPGVGVITSKLGPTDCVVAYFGAVTPAFVLAPGRPYFASLLGPPTVTRPLAPCFVQIVGVALDEARLLVNPSMNMTRLL